MIHQFKTGRHYHPTKTQIIEWFVANDKTYFRDAVRMITGVIDKKCFSDGDVLYEYDKGGYQDVTDRKLEEAEKDKTRV